MIGRDRIGSPIAMSASALPPGARATKRRGCLFYGCLTVFLLAVLAAVVGVFTVRYALKQLGAMVEQYTDRAPLALPAVEFPDADYRSLEERLAAFGEGMNAGRSVEPLVLTARELNALIARSPGLADLRDKVRVRLEGGQVTGEISLPLDRMAEVPLLSRLKGRYLNGTAGFKVALDNGVLNVTLQSLHVKGQPLPEKLLGPLRQQNLAADLYKDPEQATRLSKFQRIAVTDGQVVVEARPAP